MASAIDTSRPNAANALTSDIAGNFATASSEIGALQTTVGALGPAATGQAGATGANGPAGSAGVAGPAGPTGATGAQGATGDPGAASGGGGGAVLVSDTMPAGTQPDGTLWVDYNAPALWCYIAAHGAFFEVT